MKIILAGAGEVGMHLAKLLSKDNHEIVVIDPEESRLAHLAATCDLMTVVGPVTSLKLLLEVGTSRCDMFIAVTPYESTNVIACMLAKKLGAGLTIARIDNSEYLLKESRDFFLEKGVDSMIYPEKVATKEVTDVLSQSGVTNLVDFSGSRLSLLSIRLDKDSPIVGKTLAEASVIYQMDYRAVAISRQSNTIIPRGEERYCIGDEVYIITNQLGIKSILKWTGKVQSKFEKVMILGGTHIGNLVAKELEKKYTVKLFEKDVHVANKLSNMLPNVLVINADGTKQEVLKAEDIQHMDAFVAVTGKSETNILSCILAKNLGVKHTVAEIEDMDYISLAEQMGIDTVINKKLIAASHIFRYTLSDKISMMKTLTGTNAEVFEYEVTEGAKITKKMVKDLRFPSKAIIGGLIRDVEGVIVTGSTQIQAGDRVVVFALSSALREINSYFS